MNDLSKWREDFREDYEGMNETVRKALLVDIEMLLSRVIEAVATNHCNDVDCEEARSLRKTLGIQEP